VRVTIFIPTFLKKAFDMEFTPSDRLLYRKRKIKRYEQSVIEKEKELTRLED